VINKITGPIQRVPIQPSDQIWNFSPEKMADTIPRDVESVNVELLRGSDYFRTIMGTESISIEV